MLLAGRLVLAEQNLPLLLQPAHLLLQPALLLVQVPDGGLVGHLGGLQRADLTWEQSNTPVILLVAPEKHTEELQKEVFLPDRRT